MTKPSASNRRSVPNGGTLAISWGSYGGFYVHKYRLCLGWVAFTWLPLDLDDVLRWALRD